MAYILKINHFFVSIFFYFVLLFTDSPSTNDIETFIAKKSNSNSKLLHIDLKDKLNLANNLREACLPKLLCEIAAKPSYGISDKEQNLLDLIKWVYAHDFVVQNFRLHVALSGQNGCLLRWDKRKVCTVFQRDETWPWLWVCVWDESARRSSAF